MKARLSLVFIIAATMLWSCQFDDVLSTPSNEGVIRVTSSLTKTESASGTSTGSTTNDNFKNGEKIYVWADKTGTKDGYIKAWELTATDTKGNFLGDSKAWPYDGLSLDFHALHGHFTESALNNKNWSELTSLTHTVLPDQSYYDNRRQSDLLFAEKTEATHGSNVELSFSHLLAKITVKLDLKNSMGIKPEEFDGATVSIMGIKPESIFDSSTKKASSSDGEAIEINAGAITEPSNLSSEAYYAGCAIVPLQTINAEQPLIKITLKDRTFIYKASEETKFQEGQEYTYTLTILGKQITGSLSVSDFISATESIPFKDYFDYLADLKNRNCLGSSSAPHDLSYDYNGQMNTANCYVITHPGYYKFPLVYGNAIKNGATNANAYGVKDGTSISSTFVNHLGNLITDPYIYENSGCTVGSADLVWQDAQYLVTNIELCDDKKYIKFQITKENIQQGNAVIAVKDESGAIMWSWHIWVTNKNVYETYTYGDYKFMPIALGQRETDQGTTCTFYQWGRKDPFKPTSYTPSTGGQTYATAIKNPKVFYKGASYDWSSGHSYQLWNAGNTSASSPVYTSTKTIYDPCPPGFKVAHQYAYKIMNDYCGGFNWDSSAPGRKCSNTSDFWRAFGYLDYSSGSLTHAGTRGYYWSAGPNSVDYGYSLSFGSDYTNPTNSNARAFGFSVRPVSE